MHPRKRKPSYIVWNEPLQASGSMSKHTGQNIFALIKKKVDISTLNGRALKLDGKFTYLGTSVSSTETDIDTRVAKAWTANNRL